MLCNSMMINIIYVLVILFITKPGNADVSSRIIGGSLATITDYPYQVSLRIDNDHACGGSIISFYHVLTAAHCTFDVTENQLTVKAGSSYITKSDGQVVRVLKIYQHPHFNPDTYDNDVSVLRLASPLVLGTGVRTIRMIDAGEEIPSGASGVATGWGLISNEGNLADQLRVVILPAITTAQCTSYYGHAITPRMFCAGYQEGKKDTCTGDSGGPLVVNGILVGITSWGDAICAKAFAPGVFAKIASYRNFIDPILVLG